MTIIPTLEEQQRDTISSKDRTIEFLQLRLGAELENNAELERRLSRALGTAWFSTAIATLLGAVFLVEFVL